MKKAKNDSKIVFDFSSREFNKIGMPQHGVQSNEHNRESQVTQFNMTITNSPIQRSPFKIDLKALKERFGQKKDKNNLNTFSVGQKVAAFDYREQQNDSYGYAEMGPKIQNLLNANIPQLSEISEPTEMTARSDTPHVY